MGYFFESARILSFQQSLDRSVFGHQSWLNRQNRRFAQIKGKLSDDARELGSKIQVTLLTCFYISIF
jgi:hypothetical protein